MKEKEPRYYLYGFCNGELTEEENFNSSTMVEIYLSKHSVESPIIIYGYDMTNYFKRGR